MKDGLQRKKDYSTNLADTLFIQNDSIIVIGETVVLRLLYFLFNTLISVGIKYLCFCSVFVNYFFFLRTSERYKMNNFWLVGDI